MKDTPKYLFITNKLRHEIETGEYKANDQLPKEFDLANSYNVSRITIRNALKELENQGLIYRIQGAGTYVKDRNLSETSVSTDQLELINLKKYHLKLLDFEVGQVPEKISEALEVKPYDIVYTIKRAAVAADKQFVAFQKICIPAKVVQGLDMEMMESSIYPLVKEKIGIMPKKATRLISLVHANKEFLDENKISDQINNNEPLLKWHQQSYLQDGRAFEWNETYYRITKYPIRKAIVL